MQSNSIGQLAAALAKFQYELPTVTKGETAKVETRKGGEYRYTYADLSDVAAAVLPALAAQGLAWVCTLNGSTLTAMLVHESGEFVQSTWAIPPYDNADADPKSVGSWLTYGRRYLLMTMTGVHPAGEDDDGEKAVRRRSDDDRSAQPQKVDPLVSVIAKGREAGLTDESIRTDLDELAGGGDHRKISPTALQQLWLQYQAMVKRKAAAKAVEEAEQAASDVAAGTGGAMEERSTVDVGDSKEATVDGPAEPEAVAAQVVVPDDERATGQLKTAEALASWSDEIGPKLDQAAEDEGVDLEGDAVVGELPDGNEEELGAARLAAADGVGRLNDQLAARRRAR